jgi:hypothetical protein
MKCGTHHPEDNVCDTDSDVPMYEFEDENPLVLGRKKKASRKSRAKGGNASLMIVIDSPSLLPACKKKGARTQAQRRAILNADPWTLSVAPHHVVCRGCKKTIKLDARSLYYPGLWEKHRDRCEGVTNIRVQVRMPFAHAPMLFSDADR